MPSVDTIAAIATAPGRAGIGVIRLSGENLGDLATALCERILAPRHATLSHFRDAHGELIDQGIALFFPAPASYTGEDVLELQGHGGDAVLRALLQRCLSLGARVAEPGEFTKRAYLNGKLDLAQAEAVADLIDAATEEAAKGAARSLSGEFSARVQELVRELINLRMLVEASLDFPEEDVDFLKAANANGQLVEIEAKLNAVLLAAQQGSLLRAGLRVALVGRPNVGKSSLLNLLAGEDLAIVTPIPGTTRDPVRAPIQVDGVPLHIIDTAGLRNPTDAVELIGVERSWQAAQQANIVVHVCDASVGTTEEDGAIAKRLPSGTQVLRVFNKVDLLAAGATSQDNDAQLYMSAKTGAGLAQLKSRLLAMAGWHPGDESVIVARERHLQALHAARDHLVDARQRTAQLELFAEELRHAQQALSRISGEFTADELLGEIFSRFCIGK